MERDGGSGPEAQASNANLEEEENLLGGVGVVGIGGIGEVPADIGEVPQLGAVGESVLAVPRASVPELIAQNREFVAEHEAEVDARYDALTPEQREEVYVRPGLLLRIKQFWTGV